MSTETEQFWAGKFGNEYLERNQVDWQKRVPFFRKILTMTEIDSVLEVGCNAGQNLRAIQQVDPMISLAGCDVNITAGLEAEIALPSADITVAAANDLIETYCGYTFDLVMTAGVLIHIPSDEIRSVMKSIVDLSNRWVLAIEYSSDLAEEVNYRGHAGKLWKRPYGGIYQDLGLKPVHWCLLGHDDGFGELCTAWLLTK